MEDCTRDTLTKDEQKGTPPAARCGLVAARILREELGLPCLNPSPMTSPQSAPSSPWFPKAIGRRSVAPGEFVHDGGILLPSPSVYRDKEFAYLLVESRGARRCNPL